MTTLYRRDGDSLSRAESPTKSQLELRRKIEELRTLQAFVELKLRRHLNSCLHQYVRVAADGDLVCETCSKKFRPGLPENDDA